MGAYVYILMCLCMYIYGTSDGISEQKSNTNLFF